MLRLRRHYSQKMGLPQGTLVHIGKQYEKEIKLELVKYTKDTFQKFEIKSISECESLDDSSVYWLNVIGIHDSKIIQDIGNFFEISNLTLEEIMNTNKHPKIEVFENYIFVIARTYFYGSTHKKANFENVSAILGHNFVITFQEKENEVFKFIKQRMDDSNSLIRNKKSDYLFCAILDSLVDHYFPTLDNLGTKIDQIESSITQKQDEKLLHTIYHIRQETLIFSKILRPEREILNLLLHGQQNLIQKETLPYIHDVYEHIIHLLETIDSYRENITGLHELYLSTISNKMNEVMKMLTIIASLFIPITFVAGVYGMNFQYMPELNSQFGYPLVLIAMASITGSLFYYFKKKKWI